jgi:hypothetical protein
MQVGIRIDMQAENAGWYVGSYLGSFTGMQVGMRIGRQAGIQSGLRPGIPDQVAGEGSNTGRNAGRYYMQAGTICRQVLYAGRHAESVQAGPMKPRPLKCILTFC